jgi:hypothetical protein
MSMSMPTLNVCTLSNILVACAVTRTRSPDFRIRGEESVATSCGNHFNLPICSPLLLRRNSGENLKLQIDHRTRQLIRNTGHPIVDIARRKHRQHLVAKLLD